MIRELKKFMKNRDYLLCLDSDGCVMDTMNIKHIKCFGPSIIKKWNLYEWEDKILERWNVINLFTKTRGINRFRGLALVLEEINDKYTNIENIESLLNWINTTSEFSNNSLKVECDKTDDICLKKVLEWSIAVNKQIDELKDEEKQHFNGVVEALGKVSEFADIVVLSSANYEAIIEEWGNYNLLKNVDGIFSQEAGSKEYCVSELLKKGYKKEKIIVVGDSLGDYEAAKNNNVFFYPVLVNKEEKSWRELCSLGMSNLKNGTYSEYELNKIQEFKENLQIDI